MSSPHPPQDPGDPQYPPPGAWVPPPPGYPPAPPPAGLGLTARFGTRLVRRAEPRFGVSLAAAGALLVVAGVLVWSVGYLAAGLDLNLSFGTDQNGGVSAHGQSRRFLGAGLSLVLVIAGYVLVIARRRGPLATAGVVASAFGVPLTIGFVSFDLTDLFTGGFPVSVDAVYLVSILVWAVSYFFVPGTRGRPFYLAIAATGLAAYISLKAAGDGLTRTGLSAVQGGFSGGGDTDALAAVGLIFGLSYYAIAAFLDRRGRAGAAVGMIYAAFVTTVAGVAGAVPSFKQVGTGVLLVVLGAGLSWYGGFFGRRFTTWAWMAALLIGVGLIVGKIVPDSYTAAGIIFIVVGLAVAASAHVVSTATNEAPDIVEEAPAPMR